MWLAIPSAIRGHLRSRLENFQKVRNMMFVGDLGVGGFRGARQNCEMSDE